MSGGPQRWQPPLPPGGGGGGGSGGPAHSRSASRADSLSGISLPSPGRGLPSPGRPLGRTESLAAAADASYAAAQELASVMNAPAGGGGGWLAAAWPFAQALVQEDYDAPPPPLPPGTLPEVWDTPAGSEWATLPDWALVRPRLELSPPSLPHRALPAGHAGRLHALPALRGRPLGDAGALARGQPAAHARGAEPGCAAVVSAAVGGSCCWQLAAIPGRSCFRQTLACTPVPYRALHKVAALPALDAAVPPLPSPSGPPGVQRSCARARGRAWWRPCRRCPPPSSRRPSALTSASCGRSCCRRVGRDAALMFTDVRSTCAAPPGGCLHICTS